MKKTQFDPDLATAAAGNGLLDRRSFVRGGSAFAAAFTGYTFTRPAAAEALTDDPWSLAPGHHVAAPYGQPSRFEGKVVRTISNPSGAPGGGGARTPLHLLQGTITPNGLHFLVSRGVPDVDPGKHRLVIHGMVKRPLVFTLEALARYPMVSRIAFLECGGNSASMFSSQPVQANLQALHGQVSCAEWSGVLLSTLLAEAGVDPKAKWLIAEGADSVTTTRSVPLSKGLDDAIIALHQNGEPLMPANGYPMRLLLPGWEGNMNIKWLRRIKVTDAPAMSYPEIRTYSPLLPGGKANLFYFIQEVKSFITQPSPGLNMSGPGLYEISGLAFSGNGKIARVDVSADGGKTWAQANLQEPVLSKAFTRFRLPWRWDGSPAVLQSRARDDAGNVQPTRAEFVAVRGEVKGLQPVTAFPNHHHNGVTSWGIAASGEVKHVYI